MLAAPLKFGSQHGTLSRGNGIRTFISFYLLSIMDTSGPPLHVKVVAVTIWILSRQADLGVYYALSRQRRYNFEGTDLTNRCCSALMLASWSVDPECATRVIDALGAVDNRNRILADTFLVQSVLVNWIVEQNSKGISVDLPHAIWKYIRLWSHRSIADSAAERLRKMLWQRHARRRFGVDLRREWCLTRTTFNQAREISQEDVRRKAIGFTITIHMRTSVFFG